MQFDQADLGLARDYYLNQSKVNLLREYANRPSCDRKIKQDVDEIIKFETKIAKIMVAEEDRKNHTRMYNLRRLNDMDKLTPMVGRRF
ncbi:hypothetical protein COOONC_01599 [Cooperia oncophora]